MTAGDHLTIASGGDTTLAGAVASANQVDMTVGGHLNIQSLQDTSTYTSQQSSVGGSVSVGLGNMSGSLSMSNSRINSSYASVGEQTGIRAGDGGFNVNVGGATTLTGGVSPARMPPSPPATTATPRPVEPPSPICRTPPTTRAARPASAWAEGPVRRPPE